MLVAAHAPVHCWNRGNRRVRAVYGTRCGRKHIGSSRSISLPLNAPFPHGILILCPSSLGSAVHLPRGGRASFRVGYIDCDGWSRTRYAPHAGSLCCMLRCSLAPASMSPCHLVTRACELGIPTAVDTADTFEHDRRSDFPPNPRTQLGLRAEQSAGRYASPYCTRSGRDQKSVRRA
jgi:hypothetical protein